MVVNTISGEEEVALTLTIVVVAEDFLSVVDTTIITIITITTTIIDINSISLRLRSLMFHSQSPLPPPRLKLKSNSLQNLKNIKISFAQTGYLPIKLISIWKFRRLKGWNQSRKSLELIKTSTNIIKFIHQI
jgi:hypothetical protein